LLFEAVPDLAWVEDGFFAAAAGGCFAAAAGGFFVGAAGGFPGAFFAGAADFWAAAGPGGGRRSASRMVNSESERGDFTIASLANDLAGQRARPTGGWHEAGAAVA
jgi:hypothetical protein